MNVIGLFLLLFVVVGGAMGIFLIFGSANMHPVDSYGHTTTLAQNNTSAAAEGIMKPGAALMPWIALLVVVLILIGVFFWAIDSGGKYLGRS